MMNDLPKTKDTIVFDDRFLQQIKEGEKSITIRNSPVSLGYKNISENLSIEVVSCKKVFVWLKTRDKIAWFAKPNEGIQTQIYFKELGFESKEDMFNFYKDYLKRDFAYIITMIKIEETQIPSSERW